MKLKRQIGRKFPHPRKKYEDINLFKELSQCKRTEDEEGEGDSSCCLGMTKLNERTASKKMSCIVAQGSSSVILSWEVDMAEKLTP